MLSGLDSNGKMSKSNPETAIFAFDSPEQIKKKIKKAFCEEGNIDKNPLLEYIEYIILPKIEKINIKLETNEEKEFNNITDIKVAFSLKQIHPASVKNSVIDCLIKITDQIRQYFNDNEEARKLLELVNSFAK